MEQNFENAPKTPLALLIAVATGEYDAESSLSELFELAKSAGAEPVSAITQNLDRPESATYVGSGKLEEIAEFAKNEEIELLIFDCELSPTQIRNIEEKTDVRTIDRTMLILDIFALRANSREGKLQVELAQLKYLLPRLTGKGIEMSRLGGGIGTRGPGETKLETDRRHIRRKIEQIKAQLLQVEQHRNRLRTRRKKEGTITVALVGYTNAGKSTLLNFLTQAGVLAENKLFATLDPTSRALKLPNGVSVMLIDTVGFVRRLPHHLVEAFKSTLEEAAFADIIINVCDASNPEFTLHIDVTEKLLSELGCGGKPIITALNKIDVVQEIDFNTLQSNSGFSGDKVKISAKTGFGIDNLLAAVEDNLPVKVYRCKLLLPFSHGGISAEIRKNATLISEEYTDEGLLIEAVLDEPMWQRFKEFEKV